MPDDGGQQVSFQFQAGLVRDRVTVDISDLTLKSLKTLAHNFINEKFPEHGYTRLLERLMLFRHDYQSENILQMINAVSMVQDNTIVEVTLSTQSLGAGDVEIRPHNLLIHSYKTPTFCDLCGEMLFGMFKQGLKCEFCGMNYHKRCVQKIPNNCKNKKERRSSTSSISTVVSMPSSGITSLGNNSLYPPTKDGSVSPSISPKHLSAVHGRPAWVEVEMANRLKIPHTFVLQTFAKPTKCHYCNKLLVGVYKQGYQCKDCKFNAHKKCLEKVSKDCSGEIPLNSADGTHSDGSGEYDENADENEEDTEIEEPSALSSDNFEIGSSSFPADNRQPNIPVQRLIQSVKQTKKVELQPLKEGWMIHFTNKDTLKKRHFWRVNSKYITMYQSDTGSKYYKDIPLSEILSIHSSKKLDNENFHCFSLHTANVEYFVGAEIDMKTPSPSGECNSEEYTKAWESVISQAMMPVISKQGEPTGKDTKEVSLKGENDKEKEKDVSEIYQIFPDEVLGSGQFGIVYGGVHRISGTNVAIKMIDKFRFPSKQEAALKNEVAILKAVQHPGIVTLENMFENSQRIFLVMEKLRADMLEMILSSEFGRLNERVTRFLVAQILVALKHLHSKNVVHCDLKPENVLLVSDSDFPQVKLCDFGYSRIIGKKSFRKSIVGTPAYLAPEVLYPTVLKRSGFNRSLDMWSTGVIIYVSLSGQFPFNEDVNIEDQIRNAQFMYPEKTWKNVSKEAISCIQHLLVVQHDQRYTVEQALANNWIYQTQCVNDLATLEEKVGKQWLTPEFNTIEPSYFK